MARTTAAAVRLILDDNYNGRSSLAPYIEAATLLVDQANEQAIERDVTHSATRLEVIERWMAAWCYTQMDPTYKKKKTDKASGDFDDHSYLSVAIRLESSGSLSAIMSEEGMKTAGALWLGEPTITTTA